MYTVKGKELDKRELDMREVKQAGTFLDGCKIYLAGLNREDEAHMARVLKFAGAVRLTQLVESVTHVIIGDPGASDTVQRELATCPDLAAAQVSVDWVVSSMRAGRPLMVEEMVTSAVAGVIFTADPVTGEGGRGTITANWGLGETVVSGIADPDTLVVDSETGDVIERRIGTKMIRF